MNSLNISLLVDLVEKAAKVASILAPLIESSYNNEEISLDDRNELVERIRAAKLPKWENI